MSWAPEKQPGSNHLVLTEYPPTAPRSLWRLLRGTAHLWGNMWSCTTSLASTTGTPLSCATEYTRYSDLQAKSSSGLESRFKESIPVPMQGKIRMGISKWPYKKIPRKRKAPLKAGLLEMITVRLSLLIKSLAQEHSFALLRWPGSLRGSWLPPFPEYHKQSSRSTCNTQCCSFCLLLSYHITE